MLFRRYYETHISNPILFHNYILHLLKSNECSRVKDKFFHLVDK